jgi:hypothetical protein
MSQRCLCLVQRSEDGFVLLAEGDAPRLPALRAPAIWFAAAVEPVAVAARRLAGGSVHVLRLLLEDDVRIWEIEALSPLAPPRRGHRWAPREELGGVVTPGPRHDAALRAWVDEEEAGTAPAARPPWQRRGWLAKARAWIRKRDPSPRSDRASLTPVRGAWPGSCVIRVGAVRGARYFKATPLDAPPESALLRALSRRWANHVPEVLAASTDRRWMLLRGLSGVRPGAFTWDDIEAALALLARIQVDSTDRLAEAPFAPLPEWNLETLTTELAETAARAMEWDLWPETRSARLDRLLDRVETMVRRLQRVRLPDALLHTDFHPGNLARRRGQVVLLDWSEASRGHPFFSATRMLDYLPREELDARRPRLAEAYTAPWQRQASSKALQRAFEIAERLHPARQAVRWRRARQASEPDSPWRTIVEGALAEELARLTA